MNKNQITVTVSGPAGQGKTAIRRILQRTLAKEGIEYEVNDSDYGDSKKGDMEDVANEFAADNSIQTRRLANAKILIIEDHKTVVDKTA